MKLRLNEIQNVFTSLETSTPEWFFPHPLVVMIADYLGTFILPSWKNLLESPPAANQFDTIAYSEMELFNKNFFQVLSALDQQGNISLKLYTYHQNHSHYGGGENFDRFKALKALHWLFMVGVDQASIKYACGTKYHLLTHLETLGLLKHSAVPPLLKELLLLIPGSKEFLLDEIDQDILFRFWQPKGQFNQWRFGNTNQALIYYCECEQKYFSLITLQDNLDINAFLKLLPQYKQDAIAFEKRQKCADEAKIIADLLPLPAVLFQTIMDYITDGKYLSALAQSLLLQLKNLRQKYFDRINIFRELPQFLDKFEITLQAIVDDKTMGDIRRDFDCRSLWNERYEYKAVKKIERLIRGTQTEIKSSKYSPFYLLKFLKDLVVEEAATPLVDKFILDLLALTNMSVVEASKTLLQEKCKMFHSLIGSDKWFNYEAAQNELHSFLCNQGCENPQVDYAVDNKLADQVTLYVSSDEILTLKTLQCFSYYVNINLPDLLLNLMIKRLLSFMNDWSGSRQIKVITNFINLFIPANFDVPEKTFHITKNSQSGKYQAILRLPFHQTFRFRMFEKLTIDKFSPIYKSPSPT